MLLQAENSWAGNVLDDPRLPVEVRAYFDLVERHLPRSRLILIKNGQRGYEGPRRYFVALSDPVDPVLYEFRLNAPEEVMRISLIDLLANPQAFENHRRRRPLYLACTHGRHDVCCARYGFPIFMAALAAGHDVWQSSHVGGDRFAGNIVALPHGAYYGHVDPAETADLLACDSGGTPYLEKCRGRCCYDTPTQAAELHLWKQQEKPSFHLLRHRLTLRAAEQRWKVFFDSENSHHALTVDRTEGEPQRLPTCTALRPTRPYEFRLLAERLEGPAPAAGILYPSDGYSIRPARLRDFGMLYELRARSQSEDPSGIRRPLRIDVSRYQIIQREGAPAGCIRILCRHGEIRASAFHFKNIVDEQELCWQVVRDLLESARLAAMPLRLLLEPGDTRAAGFLQCGFDTSAVQDGRVVLRYSPTG